MTAGSKRFDGVLDFLVQQLKKGWVARIGLVMTMLVCLLLMWWSINIRLDLVHGAKAITVEQEEVRRDISLLEMKWAAENHQKINEDMQLLESKLIPDQIALAKWIESFISLAKKQRLQMVYNVGKAQQMNEDLGKVHQVPVQIILRPEGGGKGVASYRKTLEFAKSITGSKWRMDVVRASVSGRYMQFEQLELYMNLWMRGELKAGEGSLMVNPS